MINHDMLPSYEQREAIFKEWQRRGLRIRPSNVLANNGIATVAELRSLGRKGLLRLDNIGAVSAKQIEEVIGWEDSDPLDLRCGELKWMPDDNMARIANALERIADSLDGIYKAML